MSPRTLSSSILVGVLSLITLTGVASAASFSDVPSTHPNAEAIAYVKAQGIVDGYADSTYKPDQTINRAEFTKIMSETFWSLISPGQRALIGVDYCSVHTDAPFVDVPEESWFRYYVCDLKVSQYIDGYPDGTFRPANHINFVEAAKIITNGFSLTEVGGQVSVPWYRGYVEAIAVKKIIPSSITRFDQPITRGEMAEMIWRLKAGVTDKPSATYQSLTIAPKPQTVVPGWKIFNAKYFNLSFEFPQEFTIEEGPNIIHIAGPQPTPEPYGTTHYFLQLWRYTGSQTKATEIGYLKKTLLNIVEDSVNVDGTSFIRITGNASIVRDGKREQLSPKKMQYIFFEKSYIVIFGGPLQLVSSPDAIAVGNQVISTMKFSSTAR